MGGIDQVVVLVSGEAPQLKLVFFQQGFDLLDIMLLPGTEFHIVKTGFSDHGEPVVEGQIHKELFDTN